MVVAALVSAFVVGATGTARADDGDTAGGDAQFLQIIKRHIAGINNPTQGDAGPGFGYVDSTRTSGR